MASVGLTGHVAAPILTRIKGTGGDEDWYVLNIGAISVHLSLREAQRIAFQVNMEDAEEGAKGWLEDGQPGPA